MFASFLPLYLCFFPFNYFLLLHFAGKARVKSVDKINAGGNGQFNDDRSVLVNRVLSANRNKAKALHNVIFELQQHIETLTQENKDLKKAARLQDRELKRLDNAEAELPSLIKKHHEELRVLQQKFRKQKEVRNSFYLFLLVLGGPNSIVYLFMIMWSGQAASLLMPTTTNRSVELIIFQLFD